MRGERAQVTLFFIIGLVLVFTVAILYLFIGQEEMPAIDGTLDPQLSGYLSSCIDTIMEDELRTIGESGGLLPGKVEELPHGVIEGENNSIIYGITQNRNDRGARATIAPDRHESPSYPAWSIGLANTERNEDLTPMQFFQDGYFGDVWLRAVCDPEGSNAPGSLYTCRQYPRALSEPSIQSSLLTRLEDRADACASQTVFEQSFGVQVQDVQVSDVNITFTSSNILVTTTYALWIADRTQPVVLQFNRQYDVRLLPLLEFAYDVAQEESRNISFDISAGDHQNLISYRPGFNVQREGTDAASKSSLTPALTTADLIIVSDSGSRLAGKPYRFRFLAEHRPPMLDDLRTKPTRVEAQQSCNDIAKDPDETAMTCAFTDDDITLYVEDGQGQRDCLHFAGDSPSTSEDPCPS